MYLYIQMTGMLPASYTHLTSCLPVPVAFRCWRQSSASQQMLLVWLFWSQDGEIFICDVDVFPGRLCPKSRQKCAVASLFCHLVVFVIESFHGFLKCCYCKSLRFHHHHNPSECGYGSMVWFVPVSVVSDQSGLIC